MKRISGYFIELLFMLLFLPAVSTAQDTVFVPLNIRTGLELSGPVGSFFNKDILSTEASLSIDLNEKRAAMIGGGYADYKYSQYNYDYNARGMFFKAGFDFNLMGPKKSQGKYFTGLGLHYGLSRYTTAVPVLRRENYWGAVETSLPERSAIAHFIEAVPSARAEIFRNLSIGWNINIRYLVKSGTGSDLGVLYLPGFGNAGKKVSTSFSYFITFNIPYKTKRVIILPRAPEEDEDGIIPPQ